MVSLKDARYQLLKNLFGPLVSDNLCPTEVVGLSHLPERGAGLVICNHRSVMDPFLVSARSRRVINWVMAPFVSSVPIFGWLAQQAGAIPIIKGEAHKAKALIETMERVMKQGRLVGIFPEGMAGFTQTGGPCDVHDFRGTFIRAVLKARIPRLPIVPVAIYAPQTTIIGHVEGQLLSAFDRSERLFRSKNFQLVGYSKAIITFGEPETLDGYYEQYHHNQNRREPPPQTLLVEALSRHFHDRVAHLLHHTEALTAAHHSPPR